jgi:hypothetical protein
MSESPDMKEFKNELFDGVFRDTGKSLNIGSQVSALTNPVTMKIFLYIYNTYPHADHLHLLVRRAFNEYGTEKESELDYLTTFHDLTELFWVHEQEYGCDITSIGESFVHAFFHVPKPEILPDSYEHKKLWDQVREKHSKLESRRQEAIPKIESQMRKVLDILKDYDLDEMRNKLLKLHGFRNTYENEVLRTLSSLQSDATRTLMNANLKERLPHMYLEELCGQVCQSLGYFERGIEPLAEDAKEQVNKLILEAKSVADRPVKRSGRFPAKYVLEFMRYFSDRGPEFRTEFLNLMHLVDQANYERFVLP